MQHVVVVQGCQALCRISQHREQMQHHRAFVKAVWHVQVAHIVLQRAAIMQVYKSVRVCSRFAGLQECESVQECESLQEICRFAAV